ncbi:MAG TPA: hypothetical protein VFV34_08790, partial [Blastocatellia bacterium]|nr:hypothetical protein [Blastocatellia bacterium]
MDRVTCAFVLVLSLSVSGFGRAVGRQSPDEQPRVRAAALLETVIADAGSLALPENRISILIRAIDMVWRSDEKRAHALVADAIKSFTEIISGLKDDDPAYQQDLQTIYELREQMMLAISRHDAGAAIEFLRATRQPVPPQYYPYNRHPDYEADLEARLALQRSEREPAEALRLAEEALGQGFPSELSSLVAQLEQKAPAAAAKLAKLFLSRVRSEDIRQSSSANSTAFYLLARANDVQPGQAQLGARLLTQKELGDLKAIVFSAGLESISSPPAYTFSSLMDQLMPVMSEFESFVGSRAPELRAKVSEYRATKNAQLEASKEFQDLEQAPLETFLQALTKAPPAMRSNLYQQAAWKAFNESNFERARMIAEEGIADPRVRKDLLASFNEQLLWRAADEGRMNEVRERISQIASERRVSVLGD